MQFTAVQVTHVLYVQCCLHHCLCSAMGGDLQEGVAAAKCAVLSTPSNKGTSRSKADKSISAEDMLKPIEDYMVEMGSRDVFKLFSPPAGVN